MPQKEIKIGISQISFSLPLIIAKEKKLFEKESLNVKFFTHYKEAQSMCKDVVNKKLDAAGMVALPIILEQETKNLGALQFSNIAVEDTQHPFVFLLSKKNSSIKNISQLKGKKIGIFPTAAFKLWLEIILKKHKINTHDTQITQINIKNQLQALLDNTVDVIFTNDPTATKILESQEVQKISDESVLSRYVFDESVSFPIGGFVMQRDFIRKYPEEAKKINKVIDTAINILKNTSQKTSKLNYWSDEKIEKDTLQKVADIYYYNNLFKSPLNSSLLIFQPNYRIKFTNIGKERKNDSKTTQILKNFNLELKKSDFITVFGPNGSGKTTILNILAGLMKQDIGKISIDNKEINKSKVGYVYQDYRKILMPWKKVIDNIGFSLKNYKLSEKIIHKEVKDLCTLLNINLPLESYPHQLSGGQQQMTAILAALIEKPEVLLFDEPFSAIDFQTTISLQEKIMEIWQKLGITILFVSHDIDEAIFLANKICLLSNKPTKVKKLFDNNISYPRTLADKEKKEFIKIKSAVIDLYSKEVKL